MPCFLIMICLLVSMETCASLGLRKAPSKSLGEEIGSDLRAADDQIGADVDENGGKSGFQESYVDALTANDAVLENPNVSKVIAQNNLLASHLVAEDGICERQWAANCPDGWEVLVDQRCNAPASYRGACRPFQVFGSVIEKQDFAEKCKAPWPCVDACQEGHDYSATCPLDWHAIGGGFCSAHAASVTRCGASYNFGQMNIKTKQELASTCGFAWPCKSTCTQDYSQPCPEEWSEIPMNPGFCMAPSTYSGICSYGVNTATMTVAQKQSFARKCGVKFPCLGAGSVARGDSDKTKSLMLDGPVDGTGRIVATAAIQPEADQRSMWASKFSMPSGPLSG